jgi:hypothetical protein
MFHIDIVDHTQQIDMNFVPAQHLESLNNLLVGGLLPFGHAVMIVQVLRSVQAQPDVERLLSKKFAPFLVQRRAIGLNAIDNFLVRRQVLFLQLHGFAEKIDAQQCRLAAMPGEADELFGGRLNMLDDVAFESFITKAEVGSFGIKLLFFEVIAIMAV